MFNPKRLTLVRKRRRLSGEGLAKLVGVTPVTISKLEKGLHDPARGHSQGISGENLN
jgi:transcriptional regulator with XRE-family HTH domain